VLIRFSQLVADGAPEAQILPLVAETAMESARADAALVLRVGEDGDASVVAVNGVPDAMLGWRAEAETIGAEVGELLRRACGDAFAQAHVRVLASGGGLFGALVLLFREPSHVNVERFELANAIVDLAATAMNRAAHDAELRRAYDELRASQAALLRTEKLRALGQMAAGVTHDLKNILNPISLHLQVIGRAASHGNTADVKESVEEAKLAVRRGVETVERLREFSRQAPEAKLEMVDVNRLVREARDLAKARMASRKGRMNEILEELGEPPSISARTGEVVSALVNLVVNAIDAMPDGGTITLRTRAERGGAIVEVADDGPGMPPEVEKRVFEPFFTTKGEAGTGLGLAMVYACVQRHGGTIALVTAPGKGTAFTLWFPAGGASKDVT
jgi:signal transduction histidine kinase